MNPYGTPNYKDQPPCEGLPNRKIDYDTQQAVRLLESEMDEKRARFTPCVIEDPRIQEKLDATRELVLRRQPLASEWNVLLQIVNRLERYTVKSTRCAAVLELASSLLRECEAEMAPLDFELNKLSGDEGWKQR